MDNFTLSNFEDNNKTFFVTINKRAGKSNFVWIEDNNTDSVTCSIKALKYVLNGRIKAIYPIYTKYKRSNKVFMSVVIDVVNPFGSGYINLVFAGSHRADGYSRPKLANIEPNRFYYNPIALWDMKYGGGEKIGG